MSARLTLLSLLLAVLVLPAAAETVLEVAAGDIDRIDTPVCVSIDTMATADGAVTLAGPDGAIPGQLLPSKDKGKATLCFVVSLKKGQTATYKVAPATGKPEGPVFSFVDEKDKQLDLLFGDRKVTRFMYEFGHIDDAKARFAVAKPFTHVFDSTGEYVITSPGGDPYPHHRGIFLGYKVKSPRGGGDFWHVRNVWQRADGIVSTAGPAAGQMTATVLWESKQDYPVVREERTITVYRQSTPQLVLDFHSVLTPVEGEAEFGGDPEHAGCQFRPHFDVNKRGKETVYVHPDGMKPGNGGTKDMPWSSLSYAYKESRFNVAHLNHPENPKGTIYSAYRPYGRFGAFGRAKATPEKPLVLRYRIVEREGKDAAYTADEVNRLYADFATPPAVTVK